MKNIYFLADAHLGSRAIEHSRTQERRLVNFLDSIKKKAGAIYLLGDIFDYWYEYKMVVPKGYTRFLGKLSELTDRGIEVHFFAGNHDLWCGDYLEKECGVIVHKKALTVELYDKVFYLAHGDDCSLSSDFNYRMLRTMFHSRFLQTLFSSIHPRWSVDWGLSWANHSMSGHLTKKPVVPFRGEEQEPIVIFSKKYLETHPSINYFIFGHRHVEVDLTLGEHSRLLILGDWINTFSYVVFDGKHLSLERYIEGETKL